MKLAFCLSGLLIFLFQSNTETKHPNYQVIEINEVFTKLINRAEDDRIYSGQIMTQKGLISFEKQYGVQIDISDFNFKKQMLIFGITDNITTRAFQFLKQEIPLYFTLDYFETGIKYKLKHPKKGTKHSYMQVFKMERIEQPISHIRVKNYEIGKISRIYE